MVQPTTTLDVWRADDDWSGIKEKEQRKKRQNRLNQRAYRRRNTQKGEVSKDRPFRVDRFRLVEVPTPRAEKTTRSDTTQLVKRKISSPKKSQLQICLETLGRRGIYETSPGSKMNNFLVGDPRTTPIPSGYEPVVIGESITVLIPPLPTYSVDEQLTTHLSQAVGKSRQYSDALIPSPVLYDTVNAQSSTVYFPLSSDHLLHLIHHNVFRALITNKVTISSATFLARQERGCGDIVPSFSDLCDGFTIIQPTGKALPPALFPTFNQMTIGHSSWFNMFPHPRIRDNLIFNEGLFDPYDFCNDIFGELIAGRQSKVSSPESNSSMEDTDDEVTNKRRGLIVWGEPWDVEGWEVTPGFVKKWKWTLEGCEDLIAASNRWRAKRNEGPLEFLS